ncbi:winged helix-turn-helix domain-containing protein [Thalassomonas sp. RHCl1]|uniref:winged helix-turn-helix domain-containing protein n=1 Tax=Thalassomonas sp. RHCl1 TaxID=2995320 RepID=UPI00248CE431|nr:winged helix-turn-helix domain-containing protein [Thalassomonas sp. RHCl1]
MMNQQSDNKTRQSLSVLFLARPSAPAHTLLHAMGQAGLTIDLQLLTKAQLDRLKVQDHDLVVVDVDTEAPSNELITSYLSDIKATGIVAVLSNDTAENRLMALTYGAELLYSASTDLKEMQLLLRNLIARFNRPAINSSFRGGISYRPGTAASYHVGQDWIYYQRGNLISHCDRQKEVSLTKQEGKLLQTLINHQGDYVDREHLFQSLGNRDWSYDDRTVDVLIFRLRKKISQISIESDSLQTGYGTGYRLKPLLQDGLE